MLRPDEGPRDEVPRSIEESDLKQRTWFLPFPSLALASSIRNPLCFASGGTTKEEERKCY